jgi:hypothetical protein
VLNNAVERLRGLSLGPAFYVLASLVAGGLNFLAFRSVDRPEFGKVGVDLSATLAALTFVAFAALCLQFILARSTSEGALSSLSAGFVPGTVIAAAVGLVAFIVVEADASFRWGLATSLALLAITAVVPAPRIAFLLRSRRWSQLAMLMLIPPFFRLLAWRFPVIQESLIHLLLAVVVGQLMSWLAVVRLTKSDITKPRRTFSWRKHQVPTFMLIGLVMIVGLASYGRRASLGIDSTRFTDATLAGRNIFFLVAIVAYLAFPGLVDSSLFSRDLARRFRAGAVSAGAVASALLMLAAIAPSLLPGAQSSSANIDGLIRVTAIGWASLSVALIPLLYYVAHNSRFGLIVFIPVALLVVAQGFAEDPMVLSVTFATSSSALLLALIVPAAARNRRIRPQQSMASHDDVIPLGGVTIVVPSYNSGEFGPQMVSQIREVFIKEEIDVQIIAVSDGSTDDSPERFDCIAEPWFRHIRLERNEGKGAALLNGFALSTTAFTGFIDADGDIPARLLPEMLRTIQEGNADIVFGSKWHPLSVLEVSFGRRTISWIHHILQVILFNIDINDTQAGIKIYRTNMLREVLPTLREREFSLDLEIFVAAHAHGHSIFIETPIEIRRTGSSSISAKNVVTSLVDMLRIAWRARISLDYASRAYQASIHRDGATQ